LLPPSRRVARVDLALLDHSERRLRTVALPSVQTAQQPKAHALARRPSVPGLGTRWRVVWLEERQDSTRGPRVQDVVASCRVVKGAKAAAGKRSGTAGPKLGNAYLTWALSAAAGLFLRTKPAGQTYLIRLEPQPGKGKAFTIVAPTWARAVYAMRKRDTVVARQQFLPGEGSGAGAPHAELDTPGLSLPDGALRISLRPRTRRSPEALCPDPVAGAWTSAPALARRRASLPVHGCCPAPAPGAHWPTRDVEPSLCLGR
jgi:hypothetical protein